MSRVHVHVTCFPASRPLLASAHPHTRIRSAATTPHAPHPHAALRVTSHRAPRSTRLHFYSYVPKGERASPRSDRAHHFPRPPTPTPMNITELETKTVHELRDLARDL